MKVFKILFLVVFVCSSVLHTFAYHLTPQDKVFVSIIEQRIRKIYGNKEHKLSMIITLFKMIANDETKSDRVRALCGSLSQKVRTYQMGKVED